MDPKETKNKIRTLLYQSVKDGFLPERMRVSVRHDVTTAGDDRFIIIITEHGYDELEPVLENYLIPLMVNRIRRTLLVADRSLKIKVVPADDIESRLQDNMTSILEVSMIGVIGAETSKMDSEVGPFSVLKKRLETVLAGMKDKGQNGG